MACYISKTLLEASFTVDLAHDGHRGFELARAHDYDAIVLDLMLPGLDGLAVCRRLRQEQRHVPVLILSARDMVEDRAGGLDAGADDYLVKPSAVGELTARLRARQRRGSRTASPVIKVADLELNPATRVVRRGARTIVLTQKEYARLRAGRRGQPPGVPPAAARHRHYYALDEQHTTAVTTAPPDRGGRNARLLT